MGLLKYACEINANILRWEELKMNKKQLEKLLDDYAKEYGIISGKAYAHICHNHSHPLGDNGPDMVQVEVAIEAIKIAEKELLHALQ